MQDRWVGDRESGREMRGEGGEREREKERKRERITLLHHGWVSYKYYLLYTIPVSVSIVHVQYQLE